MDSGQYTPGEWEAEADILKGGHILIRSNDYAIAKVYNQELGSEQMNAANARLIAAAPNLLEACRALVTYDEREDVGPNAGVQMMIDYDHALALARAAIARATGDA